MGFLNSILDYLHDEDDDDDYDPDEYDEYEEEQQRKEEKAQRAREAKLLKEEKKREERLRKEAAAEERKNDASGKSSTGFMSKIKGILNGDDEDDDEDYPYEEEEYTEEPVRSRRSENTYQRTGKRSVIPENSHKPVINRKTTYSQQAQTGVTANFNNRPEPEAKPVTRQKSNTDRVVSFHSRNSVSNLEVSIIKPASFEECQDICDTLLAGKPIIVNLEGFNDLLVGQRIMDFVSGCVYSINGKLHQISGYIFIISPDGVEISGDYLALMKENDFGVPTFYRKN